jgi:nucleoside-diphosphate-sugar epimerase
MYKVARSDCFEPLSLSQDRMVSINELADMIAKIAGVHLNKRHISGPQGVRGRNSDNSRLREVLRWEPQISLEEGLRRTYLWIEKQVTDLAPEYSFGIAHFPPHRTGDRE